MNSRVNRREDDVALLNLIRNMSEEDKIYLVDLVDRSGSRYVGVDVDVDVDMLESSAFTDGRSHVLDAVSEVYSSMSVTNNDHRMYIDRFRETVVDGDDDAIRDLLEYIRYEVVDSISLNEDKSRKPLGYVDDVAVRILERLTDELDLPRDDTYQTQLFNRYRILSDRLTSQNIPDYLIAVLVYASMVDVRPYYLTRTIIGSIGSVPPSSESDIDGGLSFQRLHQDASGYIVDDLTSIDPRHLIDSLDDWTVTSTDNYYDPDIVATLRPLNDKLGLPGTVDDDAIYLLYDIYTSIRDTSTDQLAYDIVYYLSDSPSAPEHLWLALYNYRSYVMNLPTVNL